MVRFSFTSLLDYTFPPPQYFPVFTSSRLQVLFKRVLVWITTSSLATRALGWLTWIRVLGVEQRSTDNGIRQVSTSPSYLELPSEASVCWIINWWSYGMKWAWLNVRSPGVFVKDENITTRALKITTSELTFETGTSRIRRGVADPSTEVFNRTGGSHL